MRDWNSVLITSIVATRVSFLSYLWGIETSTAIQTGCHRLLVFIVPMRDWNITSASTAWPTARFLSYLWGIETAQRYSVDYRWFVFLSYLWGIETRFICCTNQQNKSFYRTYEGLKRSPVIRYWNVTPAFLSYLWGIETQQILAALDPEATVFIVPMRDWNFDEHPEVAWGLNFYRTYKEFTFFR